MFQAISISLSPIGPWPVLVGAASAVLALTLWAYSRRLRGTSGRWRWVALSLRLLALLLCLMAALRPSVFLKEKKRQAASLVFLIDSSKSMVFSDEVRGKTRWQVGKEALDQARDYAKGLGPDLEVKFYRFDATVNEPKEGDLTAEPTGRETDLGSAMLEVQKRQQGLGKRIARMVILSDFASNNGVNPLVAARQLKGQGVPVVTVGLGTENAGATSRDIKFRDIVTSPVVFVKNQMDVRGTLLARGFAGQTLDVELFVEGQSSPVARSPVKVPETGDVIPITGVKFIPQTPGEKKITLKVAQHDGELVPTNNEISTFVTVVSGGLNVLFLQGPSATWDYRYLMRSIGTSPDVQVDGYLIRRPAQHDSSEVPDADFSPGRYNVYVLSNLPADYLTRTQQDMLVDAVMKGAGFMMLGGHSSFGAGGWANTKVVDILPAAIHPGDGQLEPKDGIKFTPNPKGLNSFVLQVGVNREETAKIWDLMPPILGSNYFGEPKSSANILATTPGLNPEPLMLDLEIGHNGRVIAYGGDTWVWARALQEECRLAHRKLWRQIIFWLAHKENDSENQVKLTLFPRRVSVGEKLELSAKARDSKGASIPNVRYETKIARDGGDKISTPVELLPQGDEAKGSVYATENLSQPGDYTATVIARRDGQEIGHDTVRFLVYQDDRELENPSADLGLAKSIAELTDGEQINPERLLTHLKGIDRSAYTEYVTPAEYKVWDNWPFLLIFTALLTLEWWLRKRHGWV
jgi:uncharacterized membrane protein